MNIVSVSGEETCCIFETWVGFQPAFSELSKQAALTTAPGHRTQLKGFLVEYTVSTQRVGHFLTPGRALAHPSVSSPWSERTSHLFSRTREDETSTQCCTNVGPASLTLARYWSNIGWMSRVFWGDLWGNMQKMSRSVPAPAPEPRHRHRSGTIYIPRPEDTGKNQILSINRLNANDDYRRFLLFYCTLNNIGYLKEPFSTITIPSQENPYRVLLG